MKKIIYCNFIFAFILFSCEKKKEAPVDASQIEQYKKDSLRITQILTPSMSQKEMDSILNAGEKFRENPKTYFFYKLHYGRTLILQGQLEKADSLISNVLQNSELDLHSVEAARFYNLKGAVFRINKIRNKRLNTIKKHSIYLNQKMNYEPLPV